MGSVDSSIRLLLRQKGGSFQHVCRLKGHTDWIRSLAFTSTAGPHTFLRCFLFCNVSYFKSSFLLVLLFTDQSCIGLIARSLPAEGGLLLASASQDKLVRVWAIQAADQHPQDSSRVANGHASERDLARSIARWVQ